jgi:acetate kinase
MIGSPGGTTENAQMNILVLNSGSSTQKSAVFDLEQHSSDGPVPALWEGKIEWDSEKETTHVRSHTGAELRREGKAGVHRASVAAMLENIWSGPTAVLNSRDEIAIAGHRIVHGGAKLTEPTRVSSELKREIEKVASIAPLHNQAGLEGIELVEKLLPDIPQVAVFDTGFHRTLPPQVFVYPLPYSWYERDGIRRFGFHGINHEYCAHRAASLLHKDLSSLKIVTCHLGNGCSLAAIDGGKSIDTTMGFTPLEGLMMGTRSGSIDPGILIHMMEGDPKDPRRNRRDAAQIELIDETLNRQSGLLGISGVSSDMRDVLDAARNGNERAKLAFDIFIHRLQSEIGAMAASLAGFDVLVFTAGIGENSADVRRATCARLKFLGIELDETANSGVKPDADVSGPNSGVRVLVIRAQEDWSIARQCLRLMT